MRTIWLLILMAMLNGLQAQQYLYLKKENQFPRERLTVGDRIVFRTAESEDWARGTIQEISEKSLLIDAVRYPLAEIAAFRDRNDLLEITSTALWGGGLLFTGIAFINRTLNGNRPLLTQGQLITGGILVAAGLILRAVSRKTYSREEGWQWVVINLSQDQP